MFQKNQESQFNEFEMVELEESAVDNVSGACLYIFGRRVYTCRARRLFRHC
ncbi:MAG: hypothetical protein ACK5LJ_10955 [Paracoccus sp. (in: a-proteobacteria)]